MLNHKPYITVPCTSLKHSVSQPTDPTTLHLPPPQCFYTLLEADFTPLEALEALKADASTLEAMSSVVSKWQGRWDDVGRMGFLIQHYAQSEQQQTPPQAAGAVGAPAQSADAHVGVSSAAAAASAPAAAAYARAEAAGVPTAGANTPNDSASVHAKSVLAAIAFGALAPAACAAPAEAVATLAAEGAPTPAAASAPSAAASEPAAAAPAAASLRRCNSILTRRWLSGPSTKVGCGPWQQQQQEVS
jgi:hypothetical protein